MLRIPRDNVHPVCNDNNDNGSDHKDSFVGRENAVSEFRVCTWGFIQVPLFMKSNFINC